MRPHNLFITSTLLLMTLLGACNTSNTEDESQNLVATWVATTLTALQTNATIPVATSSPEANATPSPPPAPSETPMPTSTPQNPLVLETTLCWKGPGAQYDVVSALKKDQRVQLIGQGSISGWLIVDNPIYHDPCWAQAAALQIEPGYNTSALPIFAPPPTPTLPPTETRTPTVTATNTP